MCRWKGIDWCWWLCWNWKEQSVKIPWKWLKFDNYSYKIAKIRFVSFFYQPYSTSTINATRRVFRPVRRAQEKSTKEHASRSNYNENYTNWQIKESRSRINEIWSKFNKKLPVKSENTQEIESRYYINNNSHNLQSTKIYENYWRQIETLYNYWR